MKKNDKFRSTHHCIAKMYKIPAQESKIIQNIGKKVINRHSRHYVTHLKRKQEYPSYFLLDSLILVQIFLHGSAGFIFILKKNL